MKNYEDMSDFDINCRVHAEVMQISGLNSFKAKDYCNNPSDAWPIIVDNEISINSWALSDGWRADRFGHFDTEDDKPLRAAMIVFLKMNEDKL